MLRRYIILLLAVVLFHTVHASVVSGNEDDNTGSSVTSHHHDGHDHDGHDDAGHEDHTDHEGHDEDDAGHEDHGDHEGHDDDDAGHEDHDDHEGHDHDEDDNSHDDHEEHDHDDEPEDHDDHEGHDHDEDSDSHDDHEEHDHGDEPEDHDNHDDHEGHDDHDDHEGHDHGDGEHEDDDTHDDHEGHDHGDHDDHEDHDDHDDHEHHDHSSHVEDFYSELLKILKYENMNKEALSELIEKLRESLDCGETSDNICNQCVTAENIIAAAKISNVVFTEKEMEKISWILVHYMSTGENATCHGDSDIVSPSEAKTTLFPGVIFCQSNFNLIAGRISDESCEEATRCLEHTFEQEECLSTGDIEKESIMISIVYRILTCRCKLPNKEYFTESLFKTFESEDGKMSTSGFKGLLESLSIGGEVKEEVDEHAGHNHRRKRETDEHDHEHDDHDDHDNENLCYTANELLAIYNIDGARGIDVQQFTDMSPALIQQVSSKACVVESDSSLPRDITYTTAQKYGYGTAAVLIISALAFLGLLFFPVIGTTAYKITMQFFIALGVGTMSGDALLHIIPEVVGLHVHAPGEIHVGEEEDKTYTWRLLVVVGGIYIFFLFESTVRIINQVRNININLHVHDHGTGDHDHETGNTRALGNGGEAAISDEDKKEETKKDEIVCGDLTTVALMVLIGDILHNFGDGIAIGAAFSANWVTGIGTSIAIFCHELPHEFGDFAIYMNSGLSKCKALLANFAAACVAFIGLYIGLAISTDAEVRQWILSAIAGMFLYICFVDVLHEMIETKTKKPILQFLMQNLGLLLGWAILLVIAIYEDQIIGVLA